MIEAAMGATVTLNYSVRLEDGETIDSSEESGPLTFVLGDTDVISGMCAEVIGMKTGEKKTFSVQPKDAYGEPDPSLLAKIPVQFFGGEKVELGDQFVSTSEEGNEMPFIVVELGKEFITADFNHPLAGKVLTFDIEILHVQDTL
ncbi:MAG TPA: peptidylprolyl isomerase [bacterium]|nr:peptidylprolyl isomerase [bacterium]